MAICKDNLITQGLSGMLGDVIVFRQLRGKTIMANRPRKPRFQSELQRENRHRFAAASAFAKHVLQDPEKKQYYLAKARKLKLPNAYTAALTDYMRKPVVTAVKYRGNAQEKITIFAGKPGFSLASVTVTMVNEQGIALATGAAMLKDKHKNEWTATLAGQSSGDPLKASKSEDHAGICRVMVTATDHTGNTFSLAA